MAIVGFTLRSQQPEAAVKFYTEVLGLTLGERQHDGPITTYPLHCALSGATLTFRHDPSVQAGSPYELRADDNYWKFSLFVDDIVKTADTLRSRGVEVTEPVQFGEVGYLAHFNDPEGFAIELIQRTFKSCGPKGSSPTSPAGSAASTPPQLGLITLRTCDPLQSVAFYERRAGLRLFVRMYVERGKGFTLYFLGPQHLSPPSANIDAVENREWLYQQHELFVELQHYWGSEWQAEFTLADRLDEPSGFDHLTIAAPMAQHPQATSEAFTRSPAGHRVQFVQR